MKYSLGSVLCHISIKFHKYIHFLYLSYGKSVKKKKKKVYSLTSSTDQTWSSNTLQLWTLYVFNYAVN